MDINGIISDSTTINGDFTAIHGSNSRGIISGLQPHQRFFSEELSLVLDSMIRSSKAPWGCTAATENENGGFLGDIPGLDSY
jgi:hypothetical protein